MAAPLSSRPHWLKKSSSNSPSSAEGQAPSLPYSLRRIASLASSTCKLAARFSLHFCSSALTKNQKLTTNDCTHARHRRNVPQPHPQKLERPRAPSYERSLARNAVQRIGPEYFRRAFRGSLRGNRRKWYRGAQPRGRGGRVH